jgi:hypothetical protein
MKCGMRMSETAVAHMVSTSAITKSKNSGKSLKSGPCGI